MKTSTPGINKSLKTTKQPKFKEQKMDEMLLQLRQIINSNNNNQQSIQSTKGKQNVMNNQSKAASTTTIDVQSMISQSSKLVEKRKDFSSIKPAVKGKIMAASELLKDQRDMVKSYVKDKIQSELYNHDTVNQQQYNKITEDKHLLRLQQQRQLLIKKKRLEQQRQNTRRQQLISQVKEFQTDSRVGVQVHEIDNLIFKQQPQSAYLISENPTPGTHIKSTPNNLQFSTQYLSDVYAQHELEQSSRINKIIQKETMNQEQQNLQFVQINDEIETSAKYEQQFDNAEGKGLRKVLKKYPHVVKVFAEFMRNQWAIVKLQQQTIRLGSMVVDQSFHGNSQQMINSSRAISTMGIHNQNNSKVNNGYIWKNKKIKPQPLSLQGNPKPLRKQKQTISSIMQTFKFKPFTITDESKVQLQRQKISQRRVNKMIGDTAKFHSKKCILTKNELIYYQEKQPMSNGAEIYIPQATKYINLEVQRVAVEVFKKEEGSFFSKKESNIEVVSVKGKARTFKFENDFWQGKQLLADLRKLMSAKVYTLGCKINAVNNLQFLNFIYNNQANSFNLNSSLVPISCYHNKEEREKNVNILADSLVDHLGVERICFKNAKLQPNEITLLLKQSKKLQKITKIDLSNTRLAKQNFLELCQFVNQIKTPPNGLEVILSNCKLDDDCFMSNVGVFATFCMRVQRLDLSNNNITAKTVQIIKNSLENATSLIKYLNISNCPIRDLTKLNPLIKQSRKLQQLQAQNSSLSFDQKRFEQLEKFFDFLKNNSNNNLKKINLSKNGALTRKQYSMIENIWYQQSIEELVIDLDLEMINSEKGGKELMRTDNTNKNGITMKLYKPTERQS